MGIWAWVLLEGKAVNPQTLRIFSKVLPLGISRVPELSKVSDIDSVASESGTWSAIPVLIKHH